MLVWTTPGQGCYKNSLGVSITPLLTRLWSPYPVCHTFFFLTLYHVPFVLFLHQLPYPVATPWSLFLFYVITWWWLSISAVYGMNAIRLLHEDACIRSYLSPRCEVSASPPLSEIWKQMVKVLCDMWYHRGIMKQGIGAENTEPLCVQRQDGSKEEVTFAPGSH